jgi:transposase
MSRSGPSVEWNEEESEFKRRYREEKDAEVRPRLQALWLLRSGRDPSAASSIVGVHERTVWTWISWYRQGGIEEVARHHNGGRQGKESYLNDDQRDRLLEEASQRGFRTIGAAVEWAGQEFGVAYTYWGMRSLFQRMKLKKKAPRPMSCNADAQVQAEWKKGALYRPCRSGM